jgi:hypothetical protein
VLIYLKGGRMFRFYHSTLPFIALAAMTLLWGCSEESTGPSDGTGGDVSAAYTELENQMYLMSTISIKNPSDLDQVSFLKANQSYRNSVSASSNNAAANFGAGLTEILMIYYDPSVNAMIKRWDSVSLGKSSATSFFRFGIPSGTKEMSVPTQALARNMAKIVQAAVVNPPLIGEMQNLMRNNVLPHIDYALARFAVVESDPNFEFKISGKMQGDPNLDSLMLDNTEVYIMDGVLMGLKAVVEQFLVYRFDLPAYTTQAIVQALQPNNTTFFYLASDGATRSQSVLTDIKGMIGKFKSAINYLNSETDNQSDDIIKISQSGDRSVPIEDLDTTVVYLDKALNYLSTPQSITLTDADIDGNDYTIQVNIAQLYNNPPQNPKTAWFPTYSVDTSSNGAILWHWQDKDYASFNFPDPTFSGLFPGMTNANLKRILHIDEAFAWKVYVSLYNNNSPIESFWTVNLNINNSNYFPKKSSYYGSSANFTFYIMDNDNQPVQLLVLLSGAIVPLEFSAPVSVDLNNSLDISADLTLAPQNITASQNQIYVYLDLKYYNYYEIERASGSGGEFSVITLSNWYGNSYYDYSVTSGSTYRYRARIVHYSYSYSNYVYASRPNNYTNTVTVTIP